jgi:hypothetical protein
MGGAPDTAIVASVIGPAWLIFSKMSITADAGPASISQADVFIELSLRILYPI